MKAEKVTDKNHTGPVTQTQPNRGITKQQRRLHPLSSPFYQPPKISFQYPSPNLPHQNSYEHTLTLVSHCTHTLSTPLHTQKQTQEVLCSLYYINKAITHLSSMDYIGVQYIIIHTGTNAITQMQEQSWSTPTNKNSKKEIQHSVNHHLHLITKTGHPKTSTLYSLRLR